MGLRIDKGLGDYLVALKNRAATPPAGLRTVAREGLDLGDEKP
jgi:hypothetical protein